MSRHMNTAEPVLGTDSFLDVTANLVGVLIVFIVLVGLRVRKLPDTFDVDVEIERRRAAAQAEVSTLAAERLGLEQKLESLRRGLTAKHAALAGLHESQEASKSDADSLVKDQLTEQDLERIRMAELAEAQKRLVSLAKDVEIEGPPVVTHKLVHRSPFSQRLDQRELHVELKHGRVAPIDLTALLDRVRAKCRDLADDVRGAGRATSETSAVGPFRLRFTMTRDDLPFSESLYYGGGFKMRLAEWRLIPHMAVRGELVEDAIQANSQLDRVLDRHSPNDFAVTLWTYADSFETFRQVRDYLSDRGYVVAARPLPMENLIGASQFGSHSVAQ